MEAPPPPREIVLLTRRQDRKDAPIQKVVDYLPEMFGDNKALFET
ncbi:hypothetical protein [Achromobacter spanius]|nr:hypothetical protein [Achromobacter spanius]